MGTSGWDYPEWRGRFYPPSAPRRTWLAHLAARTDAVEVNATHYRLPTPGMLRRWRTMVPASYRFALKGSRPVTHRRSPPPPGMVERFCAVAAAGAGGALGPVLWQLPTDAGPFDADRLEALLAALPATVRDPTGTRRRLRHAVEVRDPRWLVPPTVAALRRRGVALVVSDAADWPTVGDLTAGFVYVRLHGPAERYASAYGPRLLARWAERIRIWAAGGVPDDVPRIDPGDPPRPPRRGRPVWVFFNNDAGAHAPADAVALRDLLGLG